MRYGIDFHGTIDAHPDLYRKLIKQLRAGYANEVYVISVTSKSQAELTALLKRMLIPVDQVVAIKWLSHTLTPKQKLAAYKDFSLDILIDDMPEVVEELLENNRLALLSL